MRHLIVSSTIPVCWGNFVTATTNCRWLDSYPLKRLPISPTLAYFASLRESSFIRFSKPKFSPIFKYLWLDSYPLNVRQNNFRKVFCPKPVLPSTRAQAEDSKAEGTPRPQRKMFFLFLRPWRPLRSFGIAQDRLCASYIAKGRDKQCHQPKTSADQSDKTIKDSRSLFFLATNHPLPPPQTVPRTSDGRNRTSPCRSLAPTLSGAVPRSGRFWDFVQAL